MHVPTPTSTPTHRSAIPVHQNQFNRSILADRCVIYMCVDAQEHICICGGEISLHPFTQSQSVIHRAPASHPNRASICLAFSSLGMQVYLCPLLAQAGRCMSFNLLRTLPIIFPIYLDPDTLPYPLPRPKYPHPHVPTPTSTPTHRSAKMDRLK